MTPPIVCWAEIPVTDIDKATTFYNTVFKWTMDVDHSGPNPMATLGGRTDTTSGHLYTGKPAGDGTGPTVHITVPDKLEDAAKRCTKAGGTVLCDPIEIPPGRFVYAIDLDGNSIGLFEAKT